MEILDLKLDFHKKPVSSGWTIRFHHLMFHYRIFQVLNCCIGEQWWILCSWTPKSSQCYLVGLIQRRTCQILQETQFEQFSWGKRGDIQNELNITWYRGCFRLFPKLFYIDNDKLLICLYHYIVIQFVQLCILLYLFYYIF